MDKVKFMLVFLASFVILITAEAYNANDIVWRRRAQEAKRAAREAYHPNPLVVTNHLNEHVHMALKGQNSTITRRRLLNAGGGACETTNPIDQCWRCDKNWEANRMKLVDCALGFGRGTTGGKGGKIYVVTDNSDNDFINPKNGTLRHAVIQTEPLWIIFSRSMQIMLQKELIMTSNKTIDGRGAHVHIVGGAGLTLQFISNVIIHNIKITDIKVMNGGMIRDSLTHYGQRGNSDGDAVNLFGATRIWLDHLSLSNCFDGLIDAVSASTAITISNCHLTHHNDVLLFGHSNAFTADKIMQITVAFNHFGRGLIQRMPRLRHGLAHVVNNDYTMWEMYAIGGSANPTILSQGNHFYAPNNINAKEVTKREYTDAGQWKSWVWKSEGDVMENGAFFVQSGDPKHDFKLGGAAIAPKGGEFAKKMSMYSGLLKCIKGLPC